MTGTLRSIALGIAAGMLVAMLGGCSTDSLPSLPKIGDLNPFKVKETPLPGRRISVMETTQSLPGELADGSSPVALPPPHVNESWSQPGGEATNAPGHLALAASPRQTWSASAGAGSGSKGRLTASPIVYQDRVYTLDADSTVTAFSASGGSKVWAVSLKPEKEQGGGFFSLGGSSGGGYGGGLAADGGRLIAASGYGWVVALDPQSGKKIWEKNLNAPIRTSPTAVSERVFVVTLEGRFYCLSGADGAEVWSARSASRQASLINNASPAVEGDVVVVPYPSGDVVALKVSDGSTVWSENLTRTRASSQLASMTDAARPAIDGGTVFAVGNAGRMVATKATTGERLWSLNLPGTQAPSVAGESVFVVDNTGQLMAVSRRDGKVQWTIKLQGGNTWSGPTLAGGTLWLASNKGQLVGVDALTGRVSGQMDVGNPVYIAPVVAQNRMFVLTDNAQLIALN